MYKQVLDIFGNINLNIIQRVEDNAFIPNDPKNRDWQEYQKWLALGNVPLSIGE